VISVTDSYVRILGFLDRSRYFSIANFCGYRVPRDQRDGFLRPYSRFSRQEPLLFYQIAPQLYSRG
jgi:hypothetical protein